MMKNLLIFILVLLIGIVSVTATDYETYYKIDEISNITLPCYAEDNNNCDDTIACNVTAINEDNVAVVSNQEMTRNDDYYNYEFTPTTLGQHQLLFKCTTGTEHGTANKKVMINGTGTNNDTTYELIFFMAGIVLVCLIFTLFFFIIKSPLKHFFLMLTLLFMTTITYLGWKIFMASSFSGILYAIYWVFLLITFMMFLFVLFEYIYIAMQYFSQKREKKDSLMEGFNP